SAAFDESSDARRVAEHLGTDHTELSVTAAEARAVIPYLPQMYDEPFGDSSQIPTHLVARLTRQHVTVALSGDAGDELFGGYNRHVWVQRLWNHFGRFPRSMRSTIAAGLGLWSPDSWDALSRAFVRIAPGDANQRNLGEKI